MTTFDILFLTLIAIIAYSYIGYGIVLYMMIKIKGLFTKQNHLYETSNLPEVTLLIAAYNEEEVIESKLINSTCLQYPSSKLKIVCITDGSTDSTNTIITNYGNAKLLFEPERNGKTAAINRAMEFISSPIVVLTDANTFLNQNAILEIVKHFSDPKVGCVSGEKKVISESSNSLAAGGEGLYWKYESKLKLMDYKLYSTAGAAGELFAIRRELFKPIPKNIILDDFVISLQIVKNGYKIAYEPKAYATEYGSVNIQEELKRKIRICAGGFQAMMYLKSLLNIFNHGVFSFQYFSHRVLRWTLAPLALFLLLPLNFLGAMANNELYTYLLIPHLLFYLLAYVGWKYELNKNRIKALFIPYYFLMMNYSVIIGFYRFISNSQSVNWEKSKRAMQ
jgi:cellulose synthase/poly-beta-1,6-N-acetylglucosamine synthase-like glycosyltransferase